MTEPLPGAVYVVDLARAVDGDTVAGLITDDRPLGYGLRQRVYSGDENGEPKEASIRLIRLDTPERGQSGYREATADARAWLLERTGRLRVEVLGAGGLGRLLGDVYVVGDRGDTLTQHMLRLGWEPWI